ncbi:MAG: hypothetical protein HOP29_05130 [Phycisphaerales bacterium]|nr:hypothetical protein [Phycisphaerales bacterium]
MRFEGRAAFVVGILLPVLETCRRGIGCWFVDFTTMFEDYVGGLLLIIAGAVSARGGRSASLWLVLAWGCVTFMMSNSVLDQIEGTLRGEEMEPNNGIVVAVKLLLWGVCVTALVCSFRRPQTDSKGQAPYRGE